MKTTLKRLLDEHGFDWEQGVIIVPAGEESQNILLPNDSEVLNREFSLNLEDKDSGTPVFTAEDPTAMYFLCHLPQEKASLFQKILLDDVEGLHLGNVRGYPYGPRNHGIDVQFNSLLRYSSRKRNTPLRSQGARRSTTTAWQKIAKRYWTFS